MEKTILLTLDDFKGHYLRDDAIRNNLADALRGAFDGEPYPLSTAGIL